MLTTVSISPEDLLDAARTIQAGASSTCPWLDGWVPARRSIVGSRGAEAIIRRVAVKAAAQSLAVTLRMADLPKLL
jgi:hypothetical protein